jgi:outer membrane scaffolding protein for murein synthesis (MipA/OmpV family)
MTHARLTIRTVTAMITSALLSTAVHAQTDTAALVPLPSVFDFTRGGGWGVALGAGVEYEAAYDGSDEYEVELDPAGAVQWRDGNHLYFWEGMELGWRGRLADVWLIQAGARYEGGLEPDDSEDGVLDGLEERDSHMVGFLETRRSIGDDWRNWVGGRLMAGESGFGVLGVVAAGHRFGDQVDGTGTEVFVFSTFGSATFINKDFGVTAADSAASGLAETDLDGGYRSTGINLIHRRYIAEHTQLIAAAEAERYNSDIGDSPIARDNHEAGVELAIVREF